MKTTDKLRSTRTNTELISKICLIILLAFFFISLHETAAQSNPAGYEGAPCQTVYVSQGECLWTIAARQVSDKEDIRVMISAIRQLNRLDANARIYPGQELRIPVKAPAIGGERGALQANTGQAGETNR